MGNSDNGAVRERRPDHFSHLFIGLQIQASHMGMSSIKQSVEESGLPAASFVEDDDSLSAQENAGQAKQLALSFGKRATLLEHRIQLLR